MLLHDTCLPTELVLPVNQTAIATTFKDCNGAVLTPGVQLAKCSDIPGPTPVTAGANVTVTGAGTAVSPYVVSAAAAAVPNGSETKVTAGANVTVSGAGTTASPYVVAAIAGALPDGSETKVTAGANTSVTGAGTTASPYVVNAIAGALPDGSETKVTEGAGINVTGTGTTANPYVVEAEPPVAETGVPATGPAAAPANLNVRNFATSVIGEVWEYLPTIGWRVVSDFYNASVSQTTNLPIGGFTTTHALTVPRSGVIDISVGTFVSCVNFPAAEGTVSATYLLKNGGLITRIGAVSNFTGAPFMASAEHGGGRVGVAVAAGDLISVVSAAEQVVGGVRTQAGTSRASNDHLAYTYTK